MMALVFCNPGQSLDFYTRQAAIQAMASEAGLGLPEKWKG